MSEEIRWQYRFANFSRAYSLLRDALEDGVEPLNRLEREGVIRRFRFAFDMSCNLLNDRLEYDGVILATITPRGVIRQAFSARLIDDGEAWMAMIADRNLMARAYDFERFDVIIRSIHSRYLAILDALYQRLLAGGYGAMTMPDPFLSDATLRMLMDVFAGYPELAEVRLFGSRATGRATVRSDIDLVTLGISDSHRLGMLALDLEDLPIPQMCDLQAYEGVKHPPLKRHIDAFGITIYRKARPPSPLG